MVRLVVSLTHIQSSIDLYIDLQGVPALFRWLSKCVQLLHLLLRAQLDEADLPSPPFLLLLFFFSFFFRQYPKIVQRVEEEDPVQIPSDEDPEVMVNIPVDITGKNPNGTEFDNLYLDVSTPLYILLELIGASMRSGTNPRCSFFSR